MKERLRMVAPVMVRVAVSLVFLWFGTNQLINPYNFVGYLPGALILNPHAASFVLANGVFEIIAGLLLIIGVWTRWAALLLSVHLLGIALSVGYGETMIRDLGLALATGSVFFRGDDTWCLQYRTRMKHTEREGAASAA